MKKRVKICLIDAKEVNLAKSHASLNIMMLASYLIDHHTINKEDVRIVNVFFEDPLDAIRDFNPDLIGLSVLTPSYPYSLKVAKSIKKVSKKPIIIGGHHISGSPSTLNKVFDVGVLGEGELPLTDIVNLLKQGKKLTNKNLRNINNLAFHKKSGGVQVNKLRPVLPSNDIPRIDWSLITKEEVYSYETVIKNDKTEVVKMSRIFTARGCPYKCKFCASQVIWPRIGGFRFFPVTRVGNEIEELYVEHGVKDIHIWTDTFAVTKVRLKQLIEDLEKRDLLGKVQFHHVFVRANLIDKEFVQMFKQFGVNSVMFGIESGSQKILSYLKNGSLLVKDVKNAAKLFGDKGILIEGSFMLFNPDEDEDDLAKSYDLARWLAKQKIVFRLEFYSTTPYPGTELWNEAVRRKLVDEYNINWQDYVLIFPDEKNVLPKVFFKGKMSDKDLVDTWGKFQAIREKVIERNSKRPGWKEGLIAGQSYRDQLINNYYKKKSRKRLVKKTIKFLKNPVLGVNQVIKKPSIISYSVKELIHIFS